MEPGMHAESVCVCVCVYNSSVDAENGDDDKD